MLLNPDVRIKNVSVAAVLLWCRHSLTLSPASVPGSGTFLDSLPSDLFSGL